MKVIELLNKIANGEEAPKKIKYKDRTYTFYTNEENDYYYQDDICYYFFLNIQCLNALNEEVEIIEEEKKIPEKVDRTKCVDFADTLEKTLNTLDSLIDYLQSKGDKE